MRWRMSGSELYSPEGKLLAFCGPFSNPEPLLLAEELLNIRAIVPETARQSLENIPDIYVMPENYEPVVRI